MTNDEIRERGQQIGVPLTARMRKGEMIRAIQRAEGNQDCFGSPWRFDCPWTECCWKDDCHARTPG